MCAGLYVRYSAEPEQPGFALEELASTKAVRKERDG